MGIALENVSKRFGNCQAIDRVNLEISSGSLLTLLGASGSGKSTLLRLIAGLETVDRGRIWLTGKDVTHQNARQRNIGFVFQENALFKHLTVWQNIAFGLEIRQTAAAQVNTKVAELLDLIQLNHLANLYPLQLSGGQRQRVALARALAITPQILLLDEPFGALDTNIRKNLRAWLRQLHDCADITTILVTHNQAEAMEISDQIAIVNQGQIEQVGTPSAIYHHPANSFVKSFLDPVNILSTTSSIFQGNSFDTTNPELFPRPQDIDIANPPTPSTVAAKVAQLIDLGPEIKTELTHHLTKERCDRLQLEPQQRVFVKSQTVTKPTGYQIWTSPKSGGNS